MSRIVLLDSGPLGMVTNPNASSENTRCTFWLRSLGANGAVIAIPEIVDYEVRRELMRARKARGLARLDDLKNSPANRFMPLNTEAMIRAASLWANARQHGRPTADPHSLDIDVILAAQAQLVEEQGDAVTVATTNVKHLSLFIHAEHWQNVTT